MQIDDQFIHCVAFIGAPTAKGFRPVGTCFFINLYEQEQTLTYAITAGHVIRDFPGDTISIRVQRKPGLSPALFNTKKDEWIFHSQKSIDICAYTVNWQEWDTNSDLDIVSLAVPQIFLTKEVAEHFGFGLGSEIFMPSAFIFVPGENQNIPIVRFGGISAMPLEPFEGSPREAPFLIETRSLHGMSGSPVFFHTNPGRRYRREPLQTHPVTGLRIVPYFLIGILVGLFRTMGNRDDFADVAAEPMPDAYFNTGLSIVIPHSQIVELVNQEELRAARSATLAEIHRLSGYQPV